MSTSDGEDDNNCDLETQQLCEESSGSTEKSILQTAILLAQSRSAINTTTSPTTTTTPTALGGVNMDDDDDNGGGAGGNTILTTTSPPPKIARTETAYETLVLSAAAASANCSSSSSSGSKPQQQQQQLHQPCSSPVPQQRRRRPRGSFGSCSVSGISVMEQTTDTTTETSATTATTKTTALPMVMRMMDDDDDILQRLPAIASVSTTTAGAEEESLWNHRNDDMNNDDDAASHLSLDQEEDDDSILPSTDISSARSNTSLPADLFAGVLSAAERPNPKPRTPGVDRHAEGMSPLDNEESVSTAHDEPDDTKDEDDETSSVTTVNQDLPLDLCAARSRATTTTTTTTTSDTTVNGEDNDDLEVTSTTSFANTENDETTTISLETTKTPASVAMTTTTTTGETSKESSPAVIVEVPFMAAAAAAAAEPDVEDVLASTDALFAQVTDKATVTVKDILTSLAAEFDTSTTKKCLSKALKAAVRQRLVDLMTAAANADDEDKDDEQENEDMETNHGDSDSVGTDESEAAVNDDDDDFASDDEKPKKARRNKRQSSSKAKTTKTTEIRTGTTSSTKKRGSRSSKKASQQTKLAQRVHAEQRRKRRLEELRLVGVRNEELLALQHQKQSAKDQERAEQIAAKFETNTDDLRMERLEKRLDLLVKLNHKRIACVQRQKHDGPSTTTTTDDTAQTDDTAKEEITPKDVAVSTTEAVFEAKDEEFSKTESDAKVQPEDSDAESSDDEEMELEVEGDRSLKFDPALKPKPKDAMSLLDMADAFKLKPTNKQRSTLTTASPGRSMNARAALRQKLKQKQRTMGNRWLARELGYATETEHLRDCLVQENRKRELILKREQERLKANERGVLRERMLNADDDDEPMDVVERVDDLDDPDDEEYTEGGVDGADEEEDEEMAMANALEEEQAEDQSDTYLPTPDSKEDDEPSPDVASFDAIDNDESEDQMMLETQAPSVATSYGASLTDSAIRFVVDESNKVSESENSPDESASAGESVDMPAINDDDDDNLFETQALLPSDLSGGVLGISYAASVAKTSGDSEKSTEETTGYVEKSASSEVSNDAEADHEGEKEVEDDTIYSAEDEPSKPKGPRNSAWLAMLKKDAEMAKKKKKSKMVEEEADEEEEEEVAGLEDFGFVVHKKKNDEEEDGDLGDFDEEDLKHVVDDVSDDEGDEEAGDNARKVMEAKEEKERHKEMLRRMRDGYDGRRGGIAVGGAGARGIHRFDQLVAADNREDAKRLGLLNDDELDSDNEEDGEKPEGGDNEEEDEAALLDKMLKDRFLHRSSVEEENFSDDEEEEDATTTADTGAASKEEDEEKEQERLAKRFAKRARMQRLIESHGHDQEFSQSKLIDEDTTLKLELQSMKNGLARKRSQSSSNSMQAPLLVNNAVANKTQMTTGPTLSTSLLNKGGSLAIALQASRRSNKTRTSFVRTTGGSSEASSSFQKCIAFNHVVFHSSSDSRSQLFKGSLSKSSKSVSTRGGMSSQSSRTGAPDLKSSNKRSSSLFSKLAVEGFQKKRKL